MSSGDAGVDLQCCVTVEQLNSSGQATRRQLIRKAAVILGRNEFQEILLRVHDGKLAHSYRLKEFQLFTKFVRDGKCTVKLLPENTQVLISNCPPDRLSLFLKTLSVKHQAWRASKHLSEREKLKAGLPRCFEAISPLQQKDIQKANELRSRVSKGPADCTNRAGGKKQVKRARSDTASSPVSSTEEAPPPKSLSLVFMTKYYQTFPGENKPQQETNPDSTIAQAEQGTDGGSQRCSGGEERLLHRKCR